MTRHISAVHGTFDPNIRRFHEQYGPVIRYSPDELSFITADAWKDIYGHNHPQMQKNNLVISDQVSNIIMCNDQDHARFRKALSFGFSERAMRNQEPILQSYIDLLIKKLKDKAEMGEKTDMVSWYVSP